MSLFRDNSVYRFFASFIALWSLFASAIASTPAADWKEYRVAAGFSVAMPAEPKERDLPTGSEEDRLHMYEAIQADPLPSKFSVFVGSPLEHGIFEPASQDAFLNGHLTAMVAAVKNGKLISSKRIEFRGLPALEYQVNRVLEGHKYVARGVAFMIDGGYVRVSMWHPADALQAEATYKRFLGSFRITPVGYVPTSSAFVAPRGISFTPPKGWVNKPVKSAFQVARFTNLTRSMVLLVSGTPTYSCGNFETELKASGRLTSVSSVRLANREFRKLVTFEDVPKHNVRLTNAQYCLDSKVGAVVLAASEEVGLYPRWEGVFEGAAASINVD